jgi:hypothetical protein
VSDPAAANGNEADTELTKAISTETENADSISTVLPAFG